MRFSGQMQEIQDNLKILYNKFYDEKGKDVFRTYASVTPAVMKEYHVKEGSE